MTKLTQLPPLSLYIHIPWCVKKCPYCDFNSHEAKKEIPETTYIDALHRDLETALPLIWGRSIRTIFIGGGTPSLFSANSINQIITMVRTLTNLSPLAEITLEANPGTLDNSRIIDYANYTSVNRISCGVQSFNNQHLKSLGRIHNKNDAIKAITAASKHFDNVNLDLIYALPNQTIDDVIKDLEIATQTGVNHISYYNLTIEPNTYFAKHIPKNLPSDDLTYKMQDTIINFLARSQFNRYEISAFAKDDHQCKHNLNYWQFGDYLGIGAGAHSKLSFADKIIRQARQKHPIKYIESVTTNQHIVEDKVVHQQELLFEFMLNSLRLIEGVSTKLFVERTGLSLNAILKQLQIAKEKQLIKPSFDSIIPTKLGHDFLNDLLLLFLPDQPNHTY